MLVPSSSLKEVIDGFLCESVHILVCSGLVMLVTVSAILFRMSGHVVNTLVILFTMSGHVGNSVGHIV